MRLLSTLMIVVFASSVMAQKVVTDSDQTYDFSGKKTIQFLGWQNDSDKIMNDLDKERMRTALHDEFQARGMSKVESGAELAVSLFIVVDQKTSTSAYTSYYGGTGYGYRGRGGYWGGGHASTTYTESDYLEGTLVMDVFDGASKELVWQGVMTGTVKEKPEKRAKSIPKSVRKLMKKFPVQPEK